MHKKNAVTWGAILITFGVLFLIGNFIPQSWPLILVGLGISFLLAAMLNKAGGLAITGMINLTLGLIFMSQVITHKWSSWVYLWPLVTAALGGGLVIAQILGTGGRKTRRVGWSWFVSGIVLAAASYYWVTFQAQSFSWAWIILGLGLQFLIVSLLSVVPGLSIPGTILSTIGAILFLQHRTGDWASWSYVWPLVLTGVGLSFMVSALMGQRAKALLWVGVYFVTISLLFFFIFAAFFARDSALLGYWPGMLIILGIIILITGFRQKAA
jgi:hypothetical protein